MKKNVLFIMLFLVLMLTSACSKDNTDKSSKTSKELLTPIPTKSPEAVVTDTVKEPALPPDAFDAEGRVVAMYGTPVIDGEVDEVWNTAGVIAPTLLSSAEIKASGEFRVLWDDNALYTLCTVLDADRNKASANAYEQDSVEVFLDELNDKASSYQKDDVHYRVNFDNEPSTDVGDSKRFFTSTSNLTDESGNTIGYIVETSLTWDASPVNDVVMGFDIQVNDAGEGGMRLGTINIFDKDGTAWSNPSSMGELIMKGKDSTSVSGASPYMLIAYVQYVEELNLDGYVNADIMTEPLKTAKAILAKDSSTQEEIDLSLASLRELSNSLDDGSGFPKISELKEINELPDPFTFFNGDKVVTPEDWTKRAEEIADLYQYYMYGVVPDTSKEVVTYKANEKNMNIQVENNGKKANITVQVSVPDSNVVKKPKDGYPVLIAFGGLSQTAYANEHGYAVITLNTEIIASDNTSRTGVFYDLYPYGDIWKEQTGTLMAWTWGVSKILDALENGAGAEYGISTTNTILTGVSRWGKAAAVAGAFEKRIKVTAPSCSGSGGMASFRYTSEGKTYDLTSIGITAPYAVGANEPLSSLQSSGERQWFNDKILDFKDVNYLPFDQHMLAALCAEEDRYLFITGSYLYEDWTNPAGMWVTYLAAGEVFNFLNISDNIAIHIHEQGHMVTDEDMVYLLDYCDYHFYGKKVKSDLEDLKTSAFIDAANYDPFFDTYLK